MIKMNSTWPAFAALLCLAGCRVDPVVVDGTTGSDSASDGGGDTDGRTEGRVGHVVVLVMDGSRIDETFGRGVSVTDTVKSSGETERISWDTETLQPEMRARLLPSAAVVQRAVATGVTITAEGHAELLTGRRVPLGNFPSDAGPVEYRSEFPSLYELTRAQFGDPAELHHLLVNTVHLEAQRWSIAPGYGADYGASYEFMHEDGDKTEPLDADAPVVRQVRTLLQTEAPRLIVANLHDMDRAGHYGAPDAYLDDVTGVDDEIASLWEWIQQTPGLVDDTVLVLVADHGRHRKGEALDYKNHNDHCSGCREIPMVLAGPLIKDGIETDTLATLADLSTTIAWLLGIDSPYADGRLLTEILDEPPTSPTARTGTTSWAATASFEAYETLLDDPDHRSAVWVDGSQRSSASATHAEAPVLLETTTDGVALDVACWREMTVGESVQEIDEWKWQGRCDYRQDQGEWTDMAFPTDPVWPFHRPALAADAGGRVWLAMTNNPNGVTDLGPESGVSLLRWTPGDGWKGEELGNGLVYYANDLSMLVDGSDAWLGFSASVAENHGRYTRIIAIQKVSWASEDSQTWRRVWQTQTSYAEEFGLGTDDPGTDYGRMERPRLRWADDGGIDVAFLGVRPDSGEVTVVTAHSADRTIFDDLVEVDDSGRVLAHLTPSWGDDGSLHWARLGETESIEVCRLAVGASLADCQDTAATALLDLTAWGTETRVTVREADGTWTTLDLSW
jgi:Metalloenzyme superfamily